MKANVTDNRTNTVSRKAAFGIRFLALATTLVLAAAALFPMGGRPSGIAVANAAVNTILSGKSGSEKESGGNQMNPADSQDVSTGSRILKNFPLTYVVEEEGEDWTSYRYVPEETYAFGTHVLRQDVLSITFLNTQCNAPKDAVDASENGDGSVLSWVVPNGNLYDLYIAANGIIYAPEDCEALFASYTSMKHIDIKNLDTSNVRNMSTMFRFCTELTELDVTNFNTENVDNMSFMFAQCKRLTALNLSSFNTANVRNMSCMFIQCEYIRSLDLSNFDTFMVTDMWNMFSRCTSLMELDVSSFDTGVVVGIGSMFNETPRLKNVTGSFDISNVEDYENFMDEGDTFNGKPWIELFQ